MHILQGEPIKPKENASQKTTTLKTTKSAPSLVKPTPENASQKSSAKTTKVGNKKGAKKNTATITNTTGPTTESAEQCHQRDDTQNDDAAESKKKEEDAVHAAYEQIVKWRRNLFDLPKGNNGKKFVDLTTRLINMWCSNSDDTTMKMVMIMPSLLLQRTSKKGKARENKQLLERRLMLWEAGDFGELVKEGKVIQDRLNKSTNKKRNEEDHLIKEFRKHMLMGKNYDLCTSLGY